MKTVLVTGSSGAIGRCLVTALKEFHPEDRLVCVKHASLSQTSKEQDSYSGDLTDPKFVSGFIIESGCTHIIHAAARRYNALDLRRQPYQIFADDLRMTLNLLDAIRDKPVWFTYLSSATVYDAGREDRFIEQDADHLPLSPSPIGAAKMLCERALRLQAQEFRTPFTIWRLFNIVSPDEPHEREGAHVAVDFYRKLFVEHAPSMEIFGDGRQVRCFTWVEDAARAVAKFLDDPRTRNQTFNLGSDEPKTLMELKDALLTAGKQSGSIRPDYHPSVSFRAEPHPDEVAARIPSINKIRQELGWKPETSFAECIEKFLAGKQKYAHD